MYLVAHGIQTWNEFSRLTVVLKGHFFTFDRRVACCSDANAAVRQAQQVSEAGPTTVKCRLKLHRVDKALLLGETLSIHQNRFVAAFRVEVHGVSEVTPSLTVLRFQRKRPKESRPPIL